MKPAQISEAESIAQTVGDLVGLALPGASLGVRLGTAIAARAIPFIVAQYDLIMAAKPATTTRDEWLAYLARVDALPAVAEAIDRRLNPSA